MYYDLSLIVYVELFWRFWISKQVVVWEFTATSAESKMPRTPFLATYSPRRQCGTNSKSNVPHLRPTCAAKRLPTTTTGPSQVNKSKIHFPLFVIFWRTCQSIWWGMKFRSTSPVPLIVFLLTHSEWQAKFEDALLLRTLTRFPTGLGADGTTAQTGPFSAFVAQICATAPVGCLQMFFLGRWRSLHSRLHFSCSTFSFYARSLILDGHKETNHIFVAFPFFLFLRDNNKRYLYYFIAGAASRVRHEFKSNQKVLVLLTWAVQAWTKFGGNRFLGKEETKKKQTNEKSTNSINCFLQKM